MESLGILRELNFTSLCLRLFLALMAGGLLGLERERKKRGAGFRTYMFVALGASLTLLLSQYLAEMLASDWQTTAKELGAHVDASRLGAQVVKGVGFLGAGTILLTERQEVKGLTTAAGLWASACLGMALGAGFYECAGISFLLILFSARVLPVIERNVNRNSPYLNLYLELDSTESLHGAVNLLRSLNIRLYDIDMEQGGKLGAASVLLNCRLPHRMPHEEILAAVSASAGIVSVEET